MSVNEKKLYQQARKKDAHWYILALITIIFGFYATEGFSLASMIPVSILGVWAGLISQMNKLQSEFLNDAKPIVKQLISQGLTEHDAMIKVNIDKFYYKPFWAVR